MSPLPARRRRPRPAARAAAVVLLLLLAAGATPRDAAARPNFVTSLPWGELNLCANCHQNPAGGGPRNAFGLAFAANARTWDAALAALDSDGDGATNGAELGDPAGAWLAGAGDPGDPRLVSVPGRADSTPGERLLVVSEVHRAAAGEVFRAEVTNLHDAPVALGGKWLVTGTSFNPAEAVAGQVRLADAATTTTLAPGAVEVVELATAGLEGWGAEAGFVLLTLFEQGGAAPPPSVDPSLSWTYGDYVAWGAAPAPFALDAQLATGLPQWDGDAGIVGPLAAGGSIEHDLAGDGRNDWYVLAEPATLGAPRPVAVAPIALGLAYPASTWAVGGIVPGREGGNFDAAQWGQPSGYPRHHAAVVEAPGRASTGAGERVLRFDRDEDARRGLAPAGAALLRPEGTPGTLGVAAWEMDVLLERLLAPGEERPEIGLRVEEAGGGADAVWEVVVRPSAAGKLWTLVGRRGTVTTSMPLVEAAAVDVAGDWVRLRWDVVRRGTGHDVELRLSNRAGAPLTPPYRMAAPAGAGGGAAAIARVDGSVLPGANGPVVYMGAVRVATDAAVGVRSAAAVR